MAGQADSGLVPGGDDKLVDIGSFLHRSVLQFHPTHTRYPWQGPHHTHEARFHRSRSHLRREAVQSPTLAKCLEPL